MSLFPKTSELADFSHNCMMSLDNYLMIHLSAISNTKVTILQLQMAATPSAWPRDQLPSLEFSPDKFYDSNQNYSTISFHILSNSYTHTFYFSRLIPHLTILKCYAIRFNQLKTMLG